MSIIRVLSVLFLETYIFILLSYFIHQRSPNKPYLVMCVCKIKQNKINILVLYHSEGTNPITGNV